VNDVTGVTVIETSQDLTQQKSKIGLLQIIDVQFKKTDTDRLE
jgi:hypothetical protein